MPRYIELDTKKIKQLTKEAQQFQDDIVCAVRTDFMQKIAEAENKMLFDILKDLENEPTADVVPRSEVEKLQNELAIMKNGINEYKVKLEQAKQEAAKQIFEDIDNIIIYQYLNNRDYSGGNMVYDLTELGMKYIGE